MSTQYRRRIGGLDQPDPDGSEDAWPDTRDGLIEAAHGLLCNVDGSAQGWAQSDEWVEAADPVDGPVRPGDATGGRRSGGPGRRAGPGRRGPAGRAAVRGPVGGARAGAGGEVVAVSRRWSPVGVGGPGSGVRGRSSPQPLPVSDRPACVRPQSSEPVVAEQPAPDGPTCVIESLTDSMLFGDPPPHVIIVDCSEHGEVARVPFIEGITYREEGERVARAWETHEDEVIGRG